MNKKFHKLFILITSVSGILMAASNGLINAGFPLGVIIIACILAGPFSALSMLFESSFDVVFFAVVVALFLIGILGGWLMFMSTDSIVKKLRFLIGALMWYGIGLITLLALASSGV
ncbi:MAG: hypothetical protein KDD62_06795 [Bdellovibrionales bacterium]|nr:hypothetical protein [Bdellovibrionales bacterium]